LRLNDSFNYYGPNILTPSVTHDILSLSFSPTGRYLAMGTSNGEIFVYDLEASKFLDFENISNPVTSGRIEAINWYPDSDIFLIATEQDKVMGFDVKSIGEIKVERFLPIFNEISNDHIHALSFSQDGGYLAISGDDNLVRVYKTIKITGGSVFYFTKVWDYPVASDDIHSLKLSRGSDGIYNLLVGSNDNNLYLYSLDFNNSIFTQKLSKEFKDTLGNGQNINTVSFSPDGLFVGGGSNNGQARVYKIDEATIPLILDIGCLFENRYNVRASVFTPDGWYFIAGGDNGKWGVFQLK
jgi:WD40 repeat protein